MRGFYRISGLALLLALPGVGAAQDLCQDIRMTQRQHADELIDDGALHADAGVVDLQAYGMSTLQDGARLRFGRQYLRADDVRYDQARREITVNGQTFFESDELSISAQGADISLDTEQAEFRDAQYVTFAAGARGNASRLQVQGSGQAELRDVRYTSCPPDKEDWVLAADKIELDSERGMGSARNARLTFKGVPLFWLPVFYFPVGEQRQSGFLAPKIGESDSTGLDIQTPFYINLAPNYDMTLTPRYMAQRGLQLGTELRYLWSHSEGRTSFARLWEDEISGEDRYLLASDIRGGAGSRWIWEGEYLQISDPNYLGDIGSEEADESESQLPRNFTLYFRDLQKGLAASLGVQKYQSLRTDLPQEDQPYARLPEMDLIWSAPYRNGLPRPSIQLNAVNFTRDETVEAWRGDAKLGLDWRYDIPQAFISSHASYRLTGYELREEGLADRRIKRELPTFQSTVGLRFLRRDKAGRHQTLQPQISYLYVPYREQDAIPVFDSSQPDFSFDQLFARNRLTGLDRIADANLITTALRTDWYSDYGRTRRLSAKLGVQWRLKDSLVSLPDGSPQDSGSSDWLGELDYQIDERWRTQVVGQWNADDNRIDQGSAALRYQRSTLSFAQVSYRFRRDNFEQVDSLIALPVSARWRVAGRWTYSLEDHRSLEALGGVEYRSCCWAAQAGWRRHLSGNGEEFNSSIFLQLELQGLGRIGKGLNTLLDRDIL